jgi:hypothetical protein
MPNTASSEASPPARREQISLKQTNVYKKKKSKKLPIDRAREASRDRGRSMLGSFAARADPTDLRRLRTAAQGWLDASSGAPGSLAVVAALPCREPGCPPFETAVQVLSEQPFSFVIRKLAADVDDDE